MRWGGWHCSGWAASRLPQGSIWSWGLVVFIFQIAMLKHCSIEWRARSGDRWCTSDRWVWESNVADFSEVVTPSVKDIRWVIENVAIWSERLGWCLASSGASTWPVRISCSLQPMSQAGCRGLHKGASLHKGPWPLQQCILLLISGIDIHIDHRPCESSATFWMLLSCFWSLVALSRSTMRSPTRWAPSQVSSSQGCQWPQSGSIGWYSSKPRRWVRWSRHLGPWGHGWTRPCLEVVVTTWSIQGRLYTASWVHSAVAGCQGQGADVEGLSCQMGSPSCSWSAWSRIIASARNRSGFHSFHLSRWWGGMAVSWRTYWWWRGWLLQQNWESIVVASTVATATMYSLIAVIQKAAVSIELSIMGGGGVGYLFYTVYFLFVLGYKYYILFLP